MLNALDGPHIILLLAILLIILVMIAVVVAVIRAIVRPSASALQAQNRLLQQRVSEQEHANQLLQQELKSASSTRRR